MGLGGIQQVPGGIQRVSGGIQQVLGGIQQDHESQDFVPDFDDLMTTNSQNESQNVSSSHISNSTDTYSSSTLHTTSTNSTSSNIEQSNRLTTLEDLAADYADLNLDGW